LRKRPSFLRRSEGQFDYFAAFVSWSRKGRCGKKVEKQKQKNEISCHLFSMRGCHSKTFGLQEILLFFKLKIFQ